MQVLVATLARFVSPLSESAASGAAALCDVADPAAAAAAAAAAADVAAPAAIGTPLLPCRPPETIKWGGAQPFMRYMHNGKTDH